MPLPITNSYIVSPPFIIVDDSDPAIQYSGTWNAANETIIKSTFFLDRTPLLNTLHVLQIFNGSFSYSFTGKYR